MTTGYEDNMSTYEDYDYLVSYMFPSKPYNLYEEEFTEVMEDMGYPYSKGFRCEPYCNVLVGDVKTWHVMLRIGNGPWTQNVLHMYSYEERAREYTWAVEKAAREYSMEYDYNSRMDTDEEYEDEYYVDEDEDDEEEY